MLLWTEKFRNALIVRTRNQKILDTVDLCCDVGGTYDAEKLRFDHH